jgi:PAS domain S-box-containing protein
LADNEGGESHALRERDQGNPMDIEEPGWLLQMKDVLETLNEGVIISDDSTRVLFVNAAFERMGGAPRSYFIGHELSHFYSEEDTKFVLEQVKKSRIDGQSRYEFFVPRADGTRLPTIMSRRVLRAPDGRDFSVVTVTDISELKRAEAELRQSNSQLSRANHELNERHREIEEDLALAARVQQSLAPRSLIWGGVRVETFYHPVRTIGGDFGLVAPFDENQLNLLVCDVSGHGIGSALVANRIYTEAIAQLASGRPLGDVLGKLNDFVLRSIDNSNFMFTVAAARLDRAGRRLSFAGAGHPPAMVANNGAEPRLLESRNMVLGALANAIDLDGTLETDLEPGDRLVLYTDGITEVFDARGEMLGIEGIRNFVRETSRMPFSEMKQGILDRVAAWRRGPATDDVSIVIVEVQ